MGIGMREVMVLLLVAVPVGGLVALPLPRKWVSLKVKRIILCAWVVIGALQIVDGVLSPHGTKMFTFGLAEIAMAGGGLLVFTELRWRRVIGGCLIAVGLVLLVTAGAMPSTATH